MRFIDRVLHPERYHGHGRRPPFFEGWYFKLVDRTGDRRLAVIPGIFLSDDPELHHAFIQVLDGRTGQATHHRFSPDLFAAEHAAFDVRIGRNRFRLDGLELDIDDDLARWQGAVRFEGLHPWPVTWRSPGIMGWYAWVPTMECYHGVLSLDHGIDGELARGGERHSFAAGRGYIEKDWGASFPAAYVWMQTNHFDVQGTSFVGSIAVIPWRRTAFRGFIIGLWHDGVLHPFATYNGARTVHLDIGDSLVEWVVERRRERLEIHATRAQGGLLLAPNRAAMGTRIGETMLATVEVRLSLGGATRFAGTGRYAGLEVHGDLGPLLGKPGRLTPN
jgi:tocopherol cyclase